MKIFLIKAKCPYCGKSTAFYPRYKDSEEHFKKMGYSVIYKVDIKKPRNPKHHNLVFGMVRCILHNLPERLSHFENYSEYEFLKLIMLEIGQTEKRRKLNGDVYEVPKSIAFETMSEDDFQPISDAISKTCAKLLEVDEDEFKRNYRDYL